MIERDGVMQLLLASSPSFTDEWDPDENVIDGERQLYLDAADYVRHVLRRVHQEASSELEPIFDAIERLHVEGDDYVRELATVGILEGFQSANADTAGVNPDLEVRPLLRPVSLAWWQRLDRFWAGDMTALIETDG